MSEGERKTRIDQALVVLKKSADHVMTSDGGGRVQLFAMLGMRVYNLETGNHLSDGLKELYEAEKAFLIQYLADLDNQEKRKTPPKESFVCWAADN